MPIEIIRKKQSAGSAFTLACDSCGKSDAEIAGFVGIDAGSFSKMKKGLATLQGDDLKKFCYAVNNRIYAEWLAYQVDCQLVVIQSEAERRAEEATKRAEDAENLVRILQNALAGRVAG